jgi:hypothetical protein
MGKPVALVKVALDGVPRAGVTNVGLVANTAEPVPVSSVKTVRKLADDGVAKNAATPVPKPEMPVATGSPVALVKVAADGVPRSGVTKAGEVANTKAPVPVSSDTAVRKLADDGVAKNVATPVPRPLTPVAIGKPVAFVKVALDGVPRAGVTNVGLLANTKAPVPVSSDTAAARLAELGVPRKVATPEPKLVIPVPPLATGKVPVTPVVSGKPVALVRVADEGVPNAGVTSVGLLDRTLLPVPVDVPTPVPPFVTLSNGPASNSASMVSKSLLILVPHVSVDAPTSGLVNNKFVVVVSAIFYLMRKFAKITSWSN